MPKCITSLVHQCEGKPGHKKPPYLLHLFQILKTSVTIPSPTIPKENAEASSSIFFTIQELPDATTEGFKTSGCITPAIIMHISCRAQSNRFEKHTLADMYIGHCQHDCMQAKEVQTYLHTNYFCWSNQ